MSKISTKREPLADLNTYFPAPPEQELVWEGEEYEKRVKSAKESRTACEVYRRYERYPGEFLIHHGYNLYHVRLAGTQGSCSCKDFFYRAGEASIPCKHIILAKIGKQLPPDPLLEEHIRQLYEALSKSKLISMPEKSTTEHPESEIGGEIPPSGSSQVESSSLISRTVDLKDAEVTLTKAPEKNDTYLPKPVGTISGGEIPPSGNQVQAQNQGQNPDRNQGQNQTQNQVQSKGGEMEIFKCKEPGCDAVISKERAISTFERYGRALCAEHEATSQKGAAPPPEAQPLGPEDVTEPELVEAELIRRPSRAHPVITMIKDIVPSLAEIGKIKIGIKGEARQSAGGKTFLQPRKLDHFEIFTNVKDKEGRLIRDEKMMKLIGEKCIELDIRLLYNRVDLNFPNRHARYEGGRCVCMGDGFIGYESEGEKGRLTKRISCNPDTCQHRINRKCKPSGVLSVILDKSEEIGGVYKFRTTSIHTISNIEGSLSLLWKLTSGVLAGIPLRMVLRPITVHPAESPTPQTVYVVHIKYAGPAEKLLSEAYAAAKIQSSHIENMKKLELLAQEALALPEPPEEAQDIQDEFYPPKPEEAKE